MPANLNARDIYIVFSLRCAHLSNVHLSPYNIFEKICLTCGREFSAEIIICPDDSSELFTRSDDPLLGSVLGEKYRLLAPVGRGGMGAVYKARDTFVDRIVAIKILHAQHVSNEVNVKRFRYEGKAASRLNHPHVIKTYDCDVTSLGQPYIVMDFLEGESLQDQIEKYGGLPVGRALKIMIQACEALAHAHKHGVIHRDVKPSNIVLAEFDNQTDYVKVVDFGVAKLLGGNQDGQRLTQAGDVCGSPVYMSPEQCVGNDLDRRSDIYSMGVVLYETFTGKLPLCGRTMVDTMSKHINEMPKKFSEVRPDLQFSERLESLVFKALAKNPEHRHQSMEQLIQELKAVLLEIDEPSEKSVVSAPSASNRFAEAPLAETNNHSNRWLVASVAILLGLVALAALNWSRLFAVSVRAERLPSVATPSTEGTSIAAPAKIISNSTPPDSKPKSPISNSSLPVESTKQLQAVMPPSPPQNTERKKIRRGVRVEKLTKVTDAKRASRKMDTPDNVSAVDPFSELRSKHSWAH